jgi:hypothetical protein
MRCSEVEDLTRDERIRRIYQANGANMTLGRLAQLCAAAGVFGREKIGYRHAIRVCRTALLAGVANELLTRLDPPRADGAGSVSN